MRLRGAGFYGKLPSAGDFKKSLPAEGPDERSLDWFNNGWARYALAGQRPDLQQPLFFAWQPPGSGVATFGAAVPSRDRSGRRFPLLVFGVATEVRSTGDLLGQASAFFARSVEVAESGRSGLDPKVLQGFTESLQHTWYQDGAADQESWEDATTAKAWAGGEAGLLERMRALDYAFASGGRPAVVVRGGWSGDLRHLAAGVKWLERRAGAALGMLFWHHEQGSVYWRATFEYALGSQFEPLLWVGSATGQAFDTGEGGVCVPESFAPTLPNGVLDGSLADLIRARSS